MKEVEDCRMFEGRFWKGVEVFRTMTKKVHHHRTSGRFQKKTEVIRMFWKKFLEHFGMFRIF